MSYVSTSDYLDKVDVSMDTNIDSIKELISQCDDMEDKDKAHRHLLDKLADMVDLYCSVDSDDLIEMLSFDPYEAEERHIPKNVTIEDGVIEYKGWPIAEIKNPDIIALQEFKAEIGCESGLCHMKGSLLCLT